MALALLNSAAATAASRAPEESLLLAVNINGLAGGDVVVVRLADGGLAVPARDLRAWRLNFPAGAPLMIGNESYVRLADLAGVEYRIDAGSQTLLLNAPAAAFTTTALAHSGKAAQGLTPSQPGGFLNYDLFWQREAGRDRGSGLFEIGAFNAWGSGTATGLWNGIGAQRGLIRLDTTWNIDMPDRMQSVRLGDAIGRAGSWGRAVRFGGIQWTTNFATQPGFVTFPLPGLRGEAALPSVLDVYLGNMRTMHNDVPPGPFDLTNVPVVTGQGELQLIVRDPLGRQQLVSQPYYASAQLLKPGLRDFSYEAGALREDYGIASARYDRFMLAATDRLGITPWFTRELRAEILAGQQTLGAGGVWQLPRIGSIYPGTLAANLAASHGPDGDGHLLSFGMDRQAQDIGYHLGAEQTDRHFARVGQLPGHAPRQTHTASISLPLAGNGLGLGYLRQSTWEGDDFRLLTASYSLRLGNTGQLGLYALRDLSGNTGLSLSLMWTMALDQRTSVSADLSRQDGRNRTTLQTQRNLPAGNGFGYRLLAGDEDRYQAGATLQTDRATFTAEAASFAGRDGYRAGVSGGVAVAGGGVFPSRRINDSFAVVKVGDFAGVRVYRDNQEVARTDERGLVLITSLRAYQENPIGIEQADLPVDAEVDTLQLKLTPALRSGVVVDFPVRAGGGASFRLVGEDGKALPPGAVVKIEGLAREFPVGYDGRAFVTSLAPDSRLLAEWGGRRCIVESLPAGPSGPLPDLGTLVCKGMPP